MVDRNEIRAAFRARLHEALDHAGVRTRGRGVDVKKHLEEAGVSKTAQAVSKWLNGESIPEPDSMLVLSSWLNVRPEWLQFGIPPRSTVSGLKHADEVDGHHISLPATRGRQVPLIAWTEVRAWCRAEHFDQGIKLTGMLCPLTISQKGFAVKVSGDSMTSYGPGKTYPSGSVIFVDPSLRAEPGDRVIAEIPHTEEVTFKIYTEDGGRRYLRAINPQYPLIDITNSAKILGKVIGVFIPD